MMTPILYHKSKTVYLKAKFHKNNSVMQVPSQSLGLSCIKLNFGQLWPKICLLTNECKMSECTQNSWYTISPIHLFKKKIANMILHCFILVTQPILGQTIRVFKKRLRGNTFMHAGDKIQIE